MAAAIDLKGVGKHYPGVTALQDLSLSVAQGEILGLLGNNGAGKTTTIKLILGLILPDTGGVSVLGHPCGSRQARDLRPQLGYLPESLRFYEQLTGREVLDYFSRLKRIAVRERDQLLEQVGLAAAADRPVATYSKGMRQRLGLAQAFLGRPRLLLLDEPSTGLDPIATQDLLDMLRVLRRDGCTIVVSTHQLAGIEQHVDRVAILHQGRMRVHGTLEMLRQGSGLPYRLRVRGEWPPAELDSWMTEWGCQEYQLDGQVLEIAASASDKIPLLRHLLAQEGVTDLELDAPNLERLYRYYSKNPEQADA